MMRQYPRLWLLLLSIVAAYALLSIGALDWLHGLGRYGYASLFFAGMLFSFGFTTAFAIAMFAELAPLLHPVPAALVAAAGSLLSDYIIFDLVRFSVFRDEIDRLRQTRLAQRIHALIHHESVPEQLRRALLFSFAGIIIASPLPDEFGVSIVSSLMRVQTKHFVIISFLCNFVGILLLLTALHTLH